MGRGGRWLLVKRVEDEVMKVGLIIPRDTPPSGGNARSAERVAEALNRSGVTADVVWFRGSLPRYDVYHAWNATRVGATLLAEGVDPARIMVTWTGTDIGQDWARDPRGWEQRLRRIPAHVVFTADARQTLLAEAPDWADRLSVIAPSVDLSVFRPEGPTLATPHPLVLVAGGVRPVKQTGWAIELVECWRRVSAADAHLVVAGPIRDPEEGRRVERLAADRPWVHLVGDQDSAMMPRWYRTADVVLNSSAVEGVSNALMEAMACGALVVAHNIPGNRALVEDGVTGRLFDNTAQFGDIMDDVQAHPVRARTFRAAARASMRAHREVHHEADRYARIYRSLVGESTHTLRPDISERRPMGADGAL